MSTIVRISSRHTRVQDNPPRQRRFDNDKIPSHKKIPNHVTWAYKKDVTIAENNQFYIVPPGNTKKVDLLFLIANAPVATGSMPESGSQSYVGTGVNMELAMEALLDMFPSFHR